MIRCPKLSDGSQSKFFISGPIRGGNCGVYYAPGAVNYLDVDTEKVKAGYVEYVYYGKETTKPFGFGCWAVKSLNMPLTWSTYFIPKDSESNKSTLTYALNETIYFYDIDDVEYTAATASLGGVITYTNDPAANNRLQSDNTYNATYEDPINIDLKYIKFRTDFHYEIGEMGFNFGYYWTPWSPLIYGAPSWSLPSPQHMTFPDYMWWTPWGDDIWWDY